MSNATFHFKRTRTGSSHQSMRVGSLVFQRTEVDKHSPILLFKGSKQISSSLSLSDLPLLPPPSPSPLSSSSCLHFPSRPTAPSPLYNSHLHPPVDDLSDLTEPSMKLLQLLLGFFLPRIIHVSILQLVPDGRRKEEEADVARNRVHQQNEQVEENEQNNEEDEEVMVVVQQQQLLLLTLGPS
eukprot:761559-Hanusia_phi.AAC.5